ncbi:MAG: hypothetical protein V4696_12620 [Pseudomonadota bacterium]
MMRQIGVDGTSVTALGKQFGGLLLPFWEDIEALFYLGNAYHAGTPSAGAPTTDLRGNGHTLARTGASVGAGIFDRWFIGNGNNYFTTSFTGEYLADSVGRVGEYAIMAWALAPHTENNDMATNAVGAAGYGNKYCSLRAATNFDCSGTFHDAVEADTPAFSFPVDALRATKFRSWLGAWRRTDTLLGYDIAGRERAIAEVRNDNITVASDIGGGPFRVGFSGGNTLNFKLASILFLNRFPSPGKALIIDRAVRRHLIASGLADLDLPTPMYPLVA